MRIPTIITCPTFSTLASSTYACGAMHVPASQHECICSASTGVSAPNCDSSESASTSHGSSTRQRRHIPNLQQHFIQVHPDPTFFASTEIVGTNSCSAQLQTGVKQRHEGYRIVEPNLWPAPTLYNGNEEVWEMGALLPLVSCHVIES